MTGLKEKLHTKTITLGTMLSEISTPNVSRILQVAGFEFIIVDCEHGYFDFSQIAYIVSVCNGFCIPVLIRIPSIKREWIIKVLDMGADGILVPMVNNVQDAKKIVNYTKYPPMGLRGISTTRAHTNYNPPLISEYVELANRRTIVMVQLETREAIRNADAIAGVEGVDVMMIGPNDLAMDMGTPGQLETSLMNSAISTVVEAAKEAGKPSGIIASKTSFLHKCQDKGMTVFSCGSEIGMILKAARGVVKDFYSR